MSVTIATTNAAILWSPYNWDLTGVAGYARTINSGAYCKFIFSGTSIKVTFDAAPNQADLTAQGNPNYNSDRTASSG